MSQLIETVEKEIIDALESDRLALPTLPEVALRIRDTADDEDASLNDLTNIISTDAAISARIIKVCNSPLLRAPDPIENLKSAVARLGMTYAADLATGLAMSQMFQATTEVIDNKMREVWDHSTEVAGLSYAYAISASRIPPPQAALAGLTHQIGILPILTYAEEHPDLIADSITLNEVIDRLHPSLGERILRAWDFSEDLCIVPSNYLDFSRDSEQLDIVDLVQVANLMTYKGSEHPYAQQDWSAIPAIGKLGIDLSEEDEEEDEDLSANMAAAMTLLSA